MMQKQLAYILGRQQIYLDVEDDVSDFDDLAEIMSNSHLNNNFLALAREVSHVIHSYKSYTMTYLSHLHLLRLYVYFNEVFL